MNNSAIHFQPWVGVEYAASFPKLLVVGESHYGDGASDGELTRRLTQEYVDGKWTYAFWTKIGKLVSGSDVPGESQTAFQKIAFYNFIQEIVSDGPRARPTDDMYARSEPAWLEVLSHLKPSHVIVLGKFVWDRLPEFADGHSRTLQVAAGTHEYGVYQINGHRLLAMALPHPSSFGFSAAKWHGHVAAFSALQGHD